MLLLPFTEERYQKNWTSVKEFIDSIYMSGSAVLKNWSFEKLYTAVYYCVLFKSGNRLYTDIAQHLRGTLTRLNMNVELEEAGRLPTSLAVKTHYGHCLPHVRATKFLMTFYNVLKPFCQVIHVLPDICMYMDKVLLGPLETDIKTELIKDFVSEVSEDYIEKALLFARSHPHAIPKDMLADLIKWLYQLHPSSVGSFVDNQIALSLQIALSETEDC